MNNFMNSSFVNNWHIIEEALLPLSYNLPALFICIQLAAKVIQLHKLIFMDILD